MSTIERALEKQRLAEEEKQKLQQQSDQLSPRPVNSSIKEHAISLEATAIPSQQIQPEQLETTTESQLTNDQITTSASTTNHFQPTAQTATRKKTQQVNIDIPRLEALGMVSPTESFTQIKEEYRYIKRPLLNNAFGPGSSTLNHPNLVMVSSSFPGEGKTFTTVNLAISMTLEEDRKVLLVDADVIKPHVCERLGITEQAGLMDYLTGKADVADIILDTNIANLKLITAGRRHHHSNEMIASDKMKQFMKELSVRYPDRIVIFDTSPLLGASETNVLAQMTGQAVIVVEQSRTSHQQVQQALSLLDPNMAIGLLLNKSNSRRREYYGYYASS